MADKSDKTVELLERGKSLYHQRKFKESEAAFTELSESGKHKEQGFYGLGVVRYQLGDLDLAEGHFKKCLEDSPDHSDALFYLGQICLRRREVEKALKFYDKAIKANPKHGAAHRQLNAYALYTLARAKRLYVQQRYKESEENFKKVIESGRYEAAGYYGVGLVQLQLGELESANKQFEQCLKSHPRHANACFYLGLIAERLRESQKSKEYYHQALEINPNHAGALRQLALMGEKVAGLQTGPADDQSNASLLQASLPTRVKPFLSAYLGHILIRTLICFVLILITLSSFSSAHLFTWCLLLILILYPILYVRMVKNAVIGFNEGRLSIDQGLLGSRLKDIDLHRVQSVELYHNFFNQFTNDGTVLLQKMPSSDDPSGIGWLIYWIIKGDPNRIKLTGIARGERLRALYGQLRDLVNSLRSNNN